MEQEHSFLVDRLRGEFLKATGPVPRELHHYTNAKGMLGIIEAGELWASNALFLNDAEELEIGLAIYKGIIAGSRTTEGANHSARVKELFDCSELHAEMLRQSAVFVTCFSAAENQLSQWRGYGGNTVGYSITFNTDGIKEMQQAGFSLLRVLYEREEQAKLVLETVAGFAAYIDSLPAEGWEHEKPRLDWFFINWLHFLLIGMKRDAFREEKEWRLASRVGRGRTDVFI